MVTVPNWLLYLQALSTPAIAVLAAVIGFMQWRTAHQRAVLDLFEKRWESYSQMRRIISDVLAHGTVSNEARLNYLRATDKAQFLFGPEVTTYLNSVYEFLVEHESAEDMMKAGGPDYAKGVEKKHATFREIAKFYVQSIALVKPYMRMHQKAPPI
jgi:hypothetical protein